MNGPSLFPGAPIRPTSTFNSSFLNRSYGASASWPSMFHNWLSFYSSLEEAKEGIISAGNIMNELYEKKH